MDNRLIEPYVNSSKNMLQDMTGISITKIGEPISDNGEFESYGVSSAISFSGRIKGRFVIDLSPELAKAIVSNMTGETMENLKDLLFLAGISELNNTIAGDANTYLNNTYALSLRLAPPIVYSGSNIIVASSNIETVSVLCDTEYGGMKLNIAFQGGAF